MGFRILNQYTGSVLFESETALDIKRCIEEAVAAGAELRGAYLQDAYLQGADLRGADLRGAYLQGADLRGADLRGAYLQGADLRDAYLRGADLEGEKQTINPIQITGLKWQILISRKHMVIACQSHSQKKWFTFSDEEISKMAPSALEFWNANKAMLKMICEEHERQSVLAEVA